MASNFTDAQNAARDSIVSEIETLNEYQRGFIEGYIVQMIAQKGV